MGAPNKDGTVEFPIERRRSTGGGRCQVWRRRRSGWRQNLTSAVQCITYAAMTNRQDLLLLIGPMLR